MDLSLGQLQHQRLEQRQVITPQILQKVEILQLTTMELEGRIQQELDENPTLEVEQPEADSDEQPEDSRNEEQELREEFERLDSLSDEWSEDYGGGGLKSTAGDKDKKLEALENTAARGTTLQDHLSAQIHLMSIPARTEEICHEIIYNIDNAGYFPFGFQDIADALPFKLSEDDFDDALNLIQSLDPIGVGARDLTECLLLQLDRDDVDYPFLRELIEHHLEEIKRNKLPLVARRTGRSLEEIKHALGKLSVLNPRPGAIFSVEETQVIIPDVLVERIDGEYQVRVENQYSPTLRISPQYRRMLEERGKDAQVRSFIKKKIESAKLLMESIEQRQMTLYNVAMELVTRQSEFLDVGVKGLKPLKMEEVAQAVGVHVSTVSRAVKNKYMQTPRGVLPMKYFFNSSMPTSGGDESQEAVKMRVKAIIDAEDKRRPLSDDEVMKILKEEGVDIARRTVSKYRKLLSIPSSRQRREF